MNNKKIKEKYFQFLQIEKQYSANTIASYKIDTKLFEKRKTDADGDDAVLYYEDKDYESLSQSLIDMGAKIVIIKSGIKGCYMRTCGRENLTASATATRS